MKTIAKMALAAVVAVAGAPAQAAPVENPSALITDFSAGSIGPVLSELGIVWREFKADDGQPFIDANYQGQFVFRLVPTACQGSEFKRCVGLSMTAVYDGRANPQTVTAFNYLYSFASVGLTPEGEAFIVRYEIADYGVPRGNVASSVLNFITQANALGAELASTRRTVALQGYAEDLSASYLNRGVLTSMTGEKVIPTESAKLHKQSMEDTANFIQDFIADKSLRRNKIKNMTVK